MPGDRRTLLATLLFTDIVGSSELAEELGDRRWRELLARHHAIVRRELKHFDGRELDTAGDGFFAAFTKPAEAVRCAAAISHGVREVGIEVRAGLHVGEAEAFGDKISGITVHIAARTMALAGPGEVLVTGVLTDLVPGARLGFEDRGARQLKGIPGEWRIFALTTVDGDIRPAPLSEQSRRERLAAIQSPRIPRRVRSPLVSLLGVIVVVGVVVPIALRAGRAHPSTQSGNPSPPPNGKLEVIDPITRKPTTIVPLDFHPGAVAFTEGSLWILDGSENRVVRVDAVSSKVEAQIPVGEDPVGIAIGAGSVWVANASGRSVSRIDPGSNQVAKTITIDFQPAQIAADEHAVWVSEKGIFGPTADAGLATIEPGTDRVIDSTRFHEAPYCPPILGTGSAQGWAADAFGKVRELEPSGKVLPFALVRIGSRRDAGGRSGRRHLVRQRRVPGQRGVAGPVEQAVLGPNPCRHHAESRLGMRPDLARRGRTVPVGDQCRRWHSLGHRYGLSPGCGQGSPEREAGRSDVWRGSGVGRG